MRRWPLVLISLLVVLVGGRYIYGIVTRKDDATQIREALAEAVKASKEGRPGGVVDKIMENFKVNDQPFSKGLIANFVKNQHPEVEFLDDTPMVNGDTAQLTSDVNVTLDMFGKKELKDVQISFRKESTLEWLIIPSSKWHLSAVRVDPASLPEMSMGWSQ